MPSCYTRESPQQSYSPLYVARHPYIYDRVRVHVGGAAARALPLPREWLGQGTTVDTARIDWSDGTFALVYSVDHFSFNAVGHGTTVFTEGHTDSGDFLSAARMFEFRATFHEITHFRSPTASFGPM